MSRVIVFCLFDSLAVRHSAVQTAPNAAVAMRSFVDALSRGEAADIVAHPGDYELVQIGNMDVETGQISPCYELLISGGAALRLARGEPELSVVGEQPDLEAVDAVPIDVAKCDRVARDAFEVVNG